MAYRFNGSSDYVQFSPAPLSGYTIGPVTMAGFFQRPSLTSDALIGLLDSGLTTHRGSFYATATGSLQLLSGLTQGVSTGTPASALNTWYLVAVTWAGTGTTPRFHINSGSGWTHVDATGTLTASAVVAGTDVLTVSVTFSSARFNGDVVCAGIKKATSTDLQVETLLRTGFQSWRDFGFDWLIGFDTSLQAAGVLQDQASPGTGDETAKVGTTVVADPAGWSWAPAAVTPVADFTGTPLTGTYPLSVAFTDSSTNTPTSWAWTFGDGGTSTVRNPTHAYAAAGTYTVTLIATNAAGSNTKTRVGYVTVSAPVVAPVADFTSTARAGYRPLTVAFTDTSTHAPTSWAWTFGDGATSTVQNPSHTYTTVGTYTVTLIATNSGGSDTETKTAWVTVSITQPVGALSVAFDDSWDVADPTWTRVDSLSGCRVRGFTVDRGRPNEFEKTGTGTATVRVVDRQGLFDPTNTASPYYGKVLPGRQAACALPNPVNGTWHTLFRGYVESWRYVLDQTRQYMELELTLTDGFAVLARRELRVGVDGTLPLPADVAAGNVGYGETAGTVGDRVLAVLADAEWPADLATNWVSFPPGTIPDVFSGNVRVGPKTYGAGTSALDALWDAADGELPGVANLYMSADGHVRFRGRQARFRPDVAQYGITHWTVGDPSAWVSDTSVVPVAELEWSNGEDNLYNSCTATPQGVGTGTTWRQLNPDPPDNDNVAGQLVTDAASVAAYGLRSLTFDNLQTVEGKATGNGSMAETKLFATYYVANYKDPHQRITRIVFKTRLPTAQNAAALHLFLCNVEISDLVTVKTDHPGAGGFNADFYVEGIHYSVTPATPAFPHVELSLDVSPRAHWTTNPFTTDPDPA